MIISKIITNAVDINYMLKSLDSFYQVIKIHNSRSKILKKCEKGIKTLGTSISRNHVMLQYSLKPVQKEFELDIACITIPNIQTCPTCM